MRFFLVIVLVVVANSLSVAQMLKVMSYNLRIDTPLDSINQWPKRTDRIVALIAKNNPDIIGVQEALHHQLQDLLKMLPDYSYCGLGRDDGKEMGEYSAILYRNSRFGLLDTRTEWLSETPAVPGSKSWDAFMSRIYTLARFFDRETKKEFIIVNTHFDHIGVMARAASAKLIKAYLAGMKAGGSTAPVIITGDFNSEPTEEPYLSMINEDHKELILFDSRPASSSAGTFCGFKVGALPCKIIDYVFHTKEWVVRNYQVISDNDGTYYPSDHLPVVVEFDLAMEK